MDMRLNSIPVDALAARQIARGGAEIACTTKSPSIHPESAITIGLRMRASFKDLTGWPMGSGRVVGLHQHPGKFKDSLWVVQCGCSKYEVRPAHRIKRARNAEIKHQDKPDFKKWVCSQCRLEQTPHAPNVAITGRPT